jgi:hypothetical protein
MQRVEDARVTLVAAAVGWREHSDVYNSARKR